MNLKFDKIKPQAQTSVKTASTDKTKLSGKTGNAQSLPKAGDSMSMKGSLFPSNSVRGNQSAGRRSSMLSGNVGFGRYSAQLASSKGRNPVLEGRMQARGANPYGRLNQLQSSGMMPEQNYQNTNTNYNTGVQNFNNNTALWNSFSQNSKVSDDPVISGIANDIQNARTPAECDEIANGLQAAIDATNNCISSLNDEFNSVSCGKMRAKNALTESKQAFEVVDLQVKGKENEVSNLEQNSSVLKTSLDSVSASVTRLEQSVGSLEQQLESAPDSEKSAIQAKLDTAKQELADAKQLQQQKLAQYNNIQEKLQASNAELLKLKEERVPLETKLKDSQDAFDNANKRLDKITSEKEEMENQAMEMLNLKNSAITKYNALSKGK